MESPSTLVTPAKSARCFRRRCGASTPSAVSAPASISTTPSQAFARRSPSTWRRRRLTQSASGEAQELIAERRWALESHRTTEVEPGIVVLELTRPHRRNAEKQQSPHFNPCFCRKIDRL